MAIYRSILLWPETVANPRLGQDVAWGVVRLDLFSQLIDENPQVLRLLDALRAPYRFEERAVSEHLFRMPRHKNQQVKFLGCEMHLSPANGNNPGLQVNVKVAGVDRF